MYLDLVKRDEALCAPRKIMRCLINEGFRAIKVEFVVLRNFDSIHRVNVVMF